MSADIFRAYEWDTPDKQYFAALGLGRDEIAIYESQVDERGIMATTRLHSMQDFGSVGCYGYSPSHFGLMAVGQSSGTVQLINLTRPAESPVKIEPKYSRPCNSLSFNTTGIVAIGLDRVRTEDSLLLYDVQVDTKISSSQLGTLLPNDAVTGLEFIPDKPTVLLCGTYKSIREIDTRTSAPAQHVPTKCSYGIRVNRLNSNEFLSYNEAGSLALWDRRQLSTNSTGTTDPVLLIPRVFSDSRSKTQRAATFSSTITNEFSALYDGSLIRRWVTSTIPSASLEVSHLSSAVSASKSADSRFVRWVLDSKTDYDRVVGYDYAEHLVTHEQEFVCIRQSGQVFRMSAAESPEDLSFHPGNDVLVLDPAQLRAMTCGDTQALDTASASGNSESDLDSATESGEDEAADEELLVPYKDILLKDINKTMQLRARAGYGSDPANNLDVLAKDSTSSGVLRGTWHWLKQVSVLDSSKQLQSDTIDLGFSGVWSIWNSTPALEGQRRVITKVAPISEKGYAAAVQKMSLKFEEDVFVSSDWREDNKAAYRQLCLRLAGWSFDLSQLEEKLVALEEAGLHEKAAGWAVFHGNVERAVQSLGQSRKSQLRLMSSAVAGYLVYKDRPENNPWREQCRKLASELSMPYLRAIFAYISDGSWLDVLDDGSLPLSERLGIALRFLPDTDLSRYLSRLTERAVASGDLEGVILTGMTPRLVDLLQVYIDKTGDVQTAALMVTYGCPRFFESDGRVDSWIEAYRHLLNRWQYFAQRCHFDVARNKLSKTQSGVSTTRPVPKQAFLRCTHCKTTIAPMKQNGQ